ncbi:unnamed protein product [Macrosiphum euphorbiae]|uniref:Uncharacterized protein n=1 Tax=Macrosiphum euphorbiae TaxID=13131 RepID=A0AAV0WBH9_9HEMI|nr:unnamed protein product [Macrosiphum euphorbiae]
MIEKSKKKSNTPIYHPHDWYQLVRRTGKVSKFQVVEMSETDFFDFSNLLKVPLMVHKLNTDREQFKWQPVSWLQYTKTGKGVLNYKTTLEENAPFKTLSFLRRGNSGTILQVKKIQWTFINIKRKKERFTRYLLPLIPPIFYQFYHELKTTNDTQDNDPDLDEVSIDGE